MRRAWLVLAAVGVAACARILGFSHPSASAFPHRAHVVAGVTCTRCHVGIDHDDGRALHLPDDTTCTSCHAKPHDTHPCMQCHAAPTALAELADARAHLTFDHARHAAPTRNDCVRCHIGVAEGDDRLRPPMATCFRCHDHDAARDARKCDACHRDLEDARELPETHLAHDGDWLREHGTRAASSGDLCQSCHRDEFCAECHGKTVAVLPATARFETRSQRRSTARASRRATRSRRARSPARARPVTRRTAARAVTLPSSRRRWPPEPAPTRLGGPDGGR